VLLGAFKELRKRHPEMTGVVAATTEPVRDQLYQSAIRLGGWPDGLDIRTGETDLVARWCDLALVVSGTVTLQLAKQARPMVIFYKTNELAYNAVGKRVITTRYFALPNLIVGHEVIPELIPYFKGIAISSRTRNEIPSQMARNRRCRMACIISARPFIPFRFDALESIAHARPGGRGGHAGREIRAGPARHHEPRKGVLTLPTLKT